MPAKGFGVFKANNKHLEGGIFETCYWNHPQLGVG